MQLTATSFEKHDLKWTRRIRKVAHFCFVGPTLISIGIVFSWLNGGSQLERIFQDFPAMGPTTATFILLLSAALFGAIREDIDPKRDFRLTRILCAGVAFAFIGSMVLESLTNTAFGHDGIIYYLLDLPFRTTNNPHPGRPSVETLSVTLLLSLSLLLLDLPKDKRGFNPSMILALLSVVIPSFVLTTYFLSGLSASTSIYPIKPLSGMPIPTAACCLMLAAGTLLSRIDRGFMPLMLSPRAGGRMARSTVLSAILSPLMLAFTLSVFSKMGLIESAAAPVFVALATIFILLVISWVTSRQVEKSDARLHETIEARERLLAVVSHDLKNPVRTILMSAELIKRKLGQKPEQIDFATHEALEGITEAGTWAQRLIRDLLISQKEKSDELHLDLQKENLTSLLGEIEHSFRPIAQKQEIQLRTITAKNLPLVMIDKKRIFQALSNLIGNALQFTPKGGTIEVSASIKENHQVEVEVKDTGVGIDKEHLDKVFLPFWQSKKNSPENLGLGLSIVQKIVVTHGGEVAIGNRPGGGARVAFTIPCSPPGH